jgi:hypothetical protein
MSPTQISEVTCGRDQGDITISPTGNVLVRSQDTARILPNNDINRACEVGTSAPPDSPVGQQTVDLGWEGLQIFDISNKASPRFVGAVATDCGSHTHTQYYDAANNRLIIYVSRSGGGNGVMTPYGTTCSQFTPKITAVEVPLSNPAAARVFNNNHRGRQQRVPRHGRSRAAAAPVRGVPSVHDPLGHQRPGEPAVAPPGHASGGIDSGLHGRLAHGVDVAER